MKILALEFSSERRSVALFANNDVCEASETSSGSTQAFALIEKVLRDSKVARADVDCIAVGLGPGSYTGIRIAISIAQGWQIAHPVKVLGLSSVETIAIQAQACGLQGTVTILIDAQGGEFYLASYKVAQNDLAPIIPLRLASADEAQVHAARGDLMTGPEIRRWFPSGHQLFPSAAVMARAASRRSDFIPGDQLQPIYLRETSFVKAPPPRTIM